jgi:hypothetical protein
MNDFTKEELEDILNCCECIISEYETKNDGMENIYALCKKIQLMINNYCEHTEFYEDHNDSVERCKKCLGAINE